MNASELYKSGKLALALDAQLKAVKADPGDQNKRLFLFELSAFTGDLERARRQLDVLKYDEMELEAAMGAYHKLLEAEEKRRRFFTDGLVPEFLSEPTEHLKLRLEAINLLREKKDREASELVARANEQLPACRGKLNDRPFDLLRDADDLFAGVLEVLARGNYIWVPFEQIELVAAKPPRFPRDLLWIPARLETLDSTGEVFLPALYPNSHLSGSEEIKLGRANDWLNLEGGMVRGVGARVFLAGDDAVNLLDWRELQIER